MINKKFFVHTALFVCMSIIYTSCLKDDSFLDVSDTQPVIEFAVGTLPTKTSSWGTLPDTTVLDTAVALNIASPQVLNYDVTVTIAIDTTMITAYNTANPTNKLNRLPDSCWQLSGTTVTIPAGYRIGRIPLKLYPTKIDPTVSYAIPLRVVSTTQTGTAPIISGNAGTLLYAFIGNPIAGNYLWDFTRYSAPSNAGSPDGTSFTGETTTFTPITPTQIEVRSGYYNQPHYEVTFTNTNGVLSNFKVTLNADDVATMTAAGITITNGPNIILADPINKKFVFQYTTLTRYVIDTFYK